MPNYVSQPQVFIERHIYGINMDSQRTRGSIHIKYGQTKDGIPRHASVSIASMGYDAAVKQAKELLQKIMREEEEARNAKRKQRRVSASVELARQDVNYVINRFGWKPVDDYFGSERLHMPIQML